MLLIRHCESAALIDPQGTPHRRRSMFERAASATDGPSKISWGRKSENTPETNDALLNAKQRAGRLIFQHRLGLTRAGRASTPRRTPTMPVDVGTIHDQRELYTKRTADAESILEALQNGRRQDFDGFAMRHESHKQGTRNRGSAHKDFLMCWGAQAAERHVLTIALGNQWLTGAVQHH